MSLLGDVTQGGVVVPPGGSASVVVGLGAG